MTLFSLSILGSNPVVYSFFILISYFNFMFYKLTFLGVVLIFFPHNHFAKSC